MAQMKKKDYLELLQPLQVHLCEMQRWVQGTGQRVVVVFEGRDRGADLAHALLQRRIHREAFATRRRRRRIAIRGRRGVFVFVFVHGSCFRHSGRRSRRRGRNCRLIVSRAGRAGAECGDAAEGEDHRTHGHGAFSGEFAVRMRPC